MKSGQSRLRSVLAAAVSGLTLLAGAVAFAGPSSAAAPVSYPPAGSVVPDSDPFYAAPPNLDTYRPGQIVATRPANAGPFGGPLTVDAWQIAYRSNDSHLDPELAVTTLVVPKAPWPGGGARPVVSVQSPEDSLGTVCAPSYLIATNNDTQDVALAGNLVAAGYAIAVPDHEGPKSVFLAGPQEGHAVLDGIRAVRAFNTDGIGTANKWALDGYSGGANASGWAAQLQPGYAPELTLAGAAIGGTPSDPAAVARFLDGGATSGFEFAAADAIATEWPESGISGVLNAKGQAAFADLKGKCESAILSGYAFQRLADYSTVPDPLSVPSIAATLHADTLGSAAPKTPIYDYHADTDEIVPVGQDDTLVTNWCAGGATVQKYRDLVGEHVEEAGVQEPAVQAFLAARFNGLPPISSC